MSRKKLIPTIIVAGFIIILSIALNAGCGGLSKKSSGYVWEKIYEGQGLSIIDASFLNEDHIWAINNIADFGFDTELILYNGMEWYSQPLGEKVILFGIYILDNEHAWAVGRKIADDNLLGTIYSVHDKSWALQYESRESSVFMDIFALSPNSVWAVGDSIVYSNGHTWVEQMQIKEQFVGVFAIGPNSVWTISTSGSVYTYDGTTWSEQKSLYGPDEKVTINSAEIYAIDSEHIWAGVYDFESEKAKIFFYDGSIWTEQLDVPDNIVLNSIDALDEEHVWATGGSNFEEECPILFYDGKSWSIQQEFDEPLFGVHAIDENNVYAVGESGSIYCGRKE